MNGAEGKVVSLNIGKPKMFVYQGKELETGIFKEPVAQRLYLTKLNFTGDGQADLINHGGSDKAVCVYSHEHYPYWEQALQRPLSVAAFGENLTVSGLLEQDVCIGDLYQLGEAVVQVSQPRQPCHKLAKRYDVRDMPLRLQNTGYTGFYFRVIEEGWVAPDESIVLLKRHPMQVTVAQANHYMHQDKHNLPEIRRILEIAELSQSWRHTFTRRLSGEATDSQKRLQG
ncbi:MOSC domain-containing protein [Brevibacillus fulvus]|uniref:MOSC domain-containing protein YiiM n=1 Tax=Brevibacillus fulvus TaxID=1125967 RepID=A0A938Y1R2_9BACL|nr:MOSC domain-containing protein [Brevibacillus fulvus]MBM7589570.1 MOSC domain-containing protein YiiM [Brevibacillus fulvus]